MPHTHKRLREINHIDLFWSVSAFSHYLGLTPPPQIVSTESLVGPVFLIATQLINLTLGFCNNLTC